MVEIKDMDVLNLTFIADSINTRSDMFVRFGPSKGIEDQKTLSNFTKLGRVSGSSIRGYLRHGVEKLLLREKISVCHPLPANVIVNERNKKIYERDLRLGYHARNSCSDRNYCLLFQMFGDIGVPSNVLINSVYFYPTGNGGTITKNHNKIFSNIGKGRLELNRNSPRSRSDGHSPFMTLESISATMIEAPFKLILREKNETHRIVLLKALEFLFEQNVNSNFTFMLGGHRSSGSGKAVIVFTNENGNYISKSRNVLGIKKEDAEEIDRKFKEIVKIEREKFPITEESDSKKNGA